MNITELGGLAKAATQGPWIEAGKGGDNLDAEGKPVEFDCVYYDRPDDPDDYEVVCRDTTHEDSMYIAAANPQTILAMIELLREMGECLLHCYAETDARINKRAEILAKYKEMTK